MWPTLSAARRHRPRIFRSSAATWGSTALTTLTGPSREDLERIAGLTASDVSPLLKALANEHRLLLLCALVSPLAVVAEERPDLLFLE